MDKKEFVTIRQILGKSQNQLSRVLCVSEKAIQSFEQGWRDIPTYIEREIMLLHALAKTPVRDSELKACWEVKDCPEEWCRKCIVKQLNIKHFCWFVNGTYCQGEYKKNWEEKIRICRGCEIFKSTFE